VSSRRASASVTEDRLHADKASRCDSLHTTRTFIIRSRAMDCDNQAESERLYRKLFWSLEIGGIRDACARCRQWWHEVPERELVESVAGMTMRQNILRRRGRAVITRC
jgi:hypothetical protein